MRHALLTAALFALHVAPAAAETRNFGLTAFDRVVVEGDYRVEIVPAPPTAARATGPRRALDALSVEVVGRTLRIRNRDMNAIRDRATRADEREGAVLVRVSTPPLRSVALAGSATVTVARIGGLNTEVLVRGSGSVQVARVDADRLTVVTEGSGTVTLSGRAKVVALSTKGTPTIDAAAVSADDVEIEADGMGTVGITASRSAKVTARGQSRVSVAGPATCVARNAGSGAVQCGKSD